MNENTNNNIEEENSTETTENINTNTDTLVEGEQSTTGESSLNEGIVLAYDYYDTYYNNVLNKLDTIITNEQTINTNLENIKTQNDTLILGCNTFIFVLILVFIYNFIRNMIIVK